MRLLKDRKAIARDTVILCAFLLVIATIMSYGIWGPYIVGVPPAKYNTGLTTKFKVIDDTTSALLEDTGPKVKVEVFAFDTDPYPKTFVGKPITAGSWGGSALGAWVATLDEGSYTVLVSDIQTTKTMYPSKLDIAVPATDSEDKETWADPSTFHVVERATIAVPDPVIKGWNVTAQGYTDTVTKLNTTAYTKWQVDYTITLSGQYKACKAGRVVVSEIDNLSPTKVLVDGVETAFFTAKSPEAVLGHYAEFGDWEGGEVHHVIFYMEAYATVASATFKMTLADAYEVQLSRLKWWTYAYDDTTVED